MNVPRMGNARAREKGQATTVSPWIGQPRAQGLFWAKIAAELGIGGGGRLSGFRFHSPCD
jgi:hypothetical protein